MCVTHGVKKLVLEIDGKHGIVYAINIVLQERSGGASLLLGGFVFACWLNTVLSPVHSTLFLCMHPTMLIALCVQAPSTLC